MRWSWKMGRIAGIDVRVHATFVLLLAWVAYGSFLTGGNWRAAAGGLAFLLSVFGVVVLHELGHALAARRFGIATRDITLLPIGGVAQLERMPEKPLQELLVAIAGPAVNVVLAVVFYTSARLVGGQVSLSGDIVQPSAFLAQLFWVNVSLALFNMLPAFPTDGGRVLRAVLAMRTSRLRATRIAVGIGKAMAFVFCAVGLFFNPILVFAAAFIWFAGSGELALAEQRAAGPDQNLWLAEDSSIEVVEVIHRPGCEPLYVVRVLPCDRPA